MSCPLFLLLFLSYFVNFSLSDPRATEAALICSNRTASISDRESFVSNYLDAMDIITPIVAGQRYAAVANGTTQNTAVYAFGECMKDLSQPDCNLCFAQVKSRILGCFPFQLGTRGGRLFYDGCYLRYDSYDFFNETFSDEDKTLCGNTTFGGGNQTVFGVYVMELVGNLSMEAPENDGFFVGSVNRDNVLVYGLAQCWEFVRGNACRNCLQEAVDRVASCPPKQEGRVLNAGCYMRYSTQKFYNNSADDPVRRDEGNSNTSIIWASVSSTFAFLLIIATITFFVRKNVLTRRKERQQLGVLSAKVNSSKLNIQYEVLEIATNYFHISNKLGQGGSGSVYKGILPDGKVVAIKRLFFNTKQWVDHFFNEVNLISSIHHKNLVKLIGCSITGPESLLVYEYIPNQSLHDYLFVKKNSQTLTWVVRYKIVSGTAEGLAYLHGESRVRIIHRDIKLSNILLDEDLTPKIADFGLARLFPEDKTHISTAVAGTLGYMAPEYVVQGKLTEKADVYSFGVVLIEILCGRTRTSFSQNSCSLVQMVWGWYKAGKVCDAVDPALQGNFLEEDAHRLFQIGLLCVQASAELRPPMSVVVKMLNGEHVIPQPTQPPFLNYYSGEISMLVPPENFETQPSSYNRSSANNTVESWVEPR